MARGECASERASVERSENQSLSSEARIFPSDSEHQCPPSEARILRRRLRVPRTLFAKPAAETLVLVTAFEAAVRESVERSESITP